MSSLPKNHWIGIALVLFGMTAFSAGVFLFSKGMANSEREDLAAYTSPESQMLLITETPTPMPSPTSMSERMPMPSPLKGIYLTSWSASSPRYIQSVIALAKQGKINAVVIDIKDFSGSVAYKTGIPEAQAYHAERNILKDVKSLLISLHKENIYAIARVVVFQDPVLAKARPELAVQSKEKLTDDKKPSEDTLWKDRNNLAWIDPAAQDAWTYTAAIARNAAEQGFDEINLDYVRFPSDGNLKDMLFPIWDAKGARHETIREFLKYQKEMLGDIPLSVDFFGLSAISRDDLGVGQIIEDTYASVDIISPMVYPSHYAKGFHGYENPAEYPYGVVAYSLETAQKRLKTFLKTQGASARVPLIRPWLQDFDRGASYNEAQVRDQIQATKESLLESYNGFVLWNPANVYTVSALEPKVCIEKNCFAVEFAKTPEERAQGLMFREQLDKETGMLFVFEEPGIHSFWMKNMRFPIDTLWIRENKIVHMEENMSPCVIEECSVFSPGKEAVHVLELPAGTIQELGLSIGNKVILP